jgi:hypothetical protein
MEFAARDVVVTGIEALPENGAVWRPVGAVVGDCCSLEQSLRFRPTFAERVGDGSKVFVGLDVELCCAATEHGTGSVERYRVTYRHHGITWSAVRRLPRDSWLLVRA